MKTVLSMVACVAVAVAALGMVTVLTGCQSPGAAATAKTIDVCPQCEGKTSVVPAGDVDYTKHVCVSCKMVSTIDPHAPASMRDYVDPIERTVCVCDHCGAVVSTCPSCKAK